MTDMRRTVLLVVFFMSIFLLWDGWQKYNGHPSMFAPAAKPTATAAGNNPGNAASAAPAALTGNATGGAAANGTTAAAAPAASAPVASEMVTISTDLFKATLDTRGGSLARVELLKQADDSDPSGHVVVFDTSATRFYQAQTGLTGVAGAPTHLTVMHLVSPERALKDGVDTLTLRFESPVEAGLQLIKTYTFRRGDYVIGVKHEIINTSSAPLAPQLYVQLVRDGYEPVPQSKMSRKYFTGPALYTDKQKFEKFAFADIDKNDVEFAPRADDGWIAMLEHYFSSAWLHQAPGERGFYVNRVAGSNPAQYAVGMVFPLSQIAPGASVSTEDQLFVGPNDEKLLAGIAPSLGLVRDYGRMTVIAQPLFWLLSHLHGLIGNWGWSIVALVVLLKIAFFGLNAKAFKSMAKMKALNPKIQEMRERLKDKPQEMQQAMMRIYKEEGVNPLGSCLPIVVQMPVFFALYGVLLSSVEMRHAPWIGWITDLSASDPYFILPIIYTCTSLLQTWLNPRPADPMQAKLMWFMPLAFSVMFLFFPAGLVLYWVTNNLLTIAQQWLINKKLGVRN